MPTLKIRGIEVEFPFKPYDVQLQYMTKVIESLQNGKNALLESPTGTGKTLCLLCATLAWRRAEIKLKTQNRSVPDENEPDYPLGWGQSDKIPGQDAEFSPPSAPKIIYASRTHSQLTQVVSELKRTAYAKDTKISILGSREQMCIHPEVSKQTNNTAMIHMCRNKVNKHLCHFYNNVENARKAGYFTNEVLDIEELVTVGKKRNACPYYAAREQSKEGECGIIFTPYNYLLDRKARRSHNLEVQGNIIIFDEAHNLEKMCEESASFDITSLDIAHCVEEVGEVLIAANKLAETGIIPDGHEAGESSTLSEFNKEELATLKVLFLALEKHLDDIELRGAERSRTEKGRFMFEFLSQVNLNFSTHEALLDLIDKVVSYLSTLSNSFQTRGTALQKFSEIIKIVFSSSDGGSNSSLLPSTIHQTPVISEMMMQELSKFYRVHIQEEIPENKNERESSFKPSSSKNKKPKKTLSYWCFSPGYAMRDLIACGVKGLILTSGTLSPIESFTCELQVDFPITLQNSHVIDSHQVFVATVTTGVTGKRLESTYKARNNTELSQELGNTIVRIARNCPGGLLVFFPSYFAMTLYTKAWDEFPSRVMSAIEAVKPYTVEPRNKHELKGAMEKYYGDVGKPQGGTFFAVCRGKVSEGLDFANDNGRGVVIIGLPFPPSKDPKVRLKMQFLEDLRIGGAKKVINGQEWYRLQALRAVNQAIGRVIRHRHDYGAILLCDHRYTKHENRSELPKWIQGRINNFDNCEKALRRLKSFFCSVEQKEKVRLGKVMIKSAEDRSKRDDEDSSLKPGTSKDQIFFGSSMKNRQRDGTVSQYFSKSKNNGKISDEQLQSIPKTNDFSDHLASTVFPNSSKESCLECSGSESSSKRKRLSEDEVEQSLITRKNSKKAKGPKLFEALEMGSTPSRQEEIGHVIAEEAATRLSTHVLAMDKRLDDERRGAVRKKIKIVKSAPVKNTDAPAKEINSETSPISNADTMTKRAFELDEEKLKQNDIKYYLNAVRQSLNPVQYKSFKQMLVHYTKDKNLNALIPKLSDVFLDIKAFYPLFRSFVRFIPIPDREEFSKICENLTGKSCTLSTS